MKKRIFSKIFLVFIIFFIIAGVIVSYQKNIYAINGTDEDNMANSPVAPPPAGPAPAGDENPCAKYGPSSVQCTGDTGCFLQGTKIEVGNGTKNIEDIKQGDKVLSFDSKTNNVVSNTVNTVFSFTRDHYNLLKTKSGKEVKVTDEHPFYIGNDTFKTVKELKAGDVVYTKENNTLTKDTISSIERVKGTQTVYNMSVGSPNTYFANDFAVHNKKSPGVQNARYVCQDGTGPTYPLTGITVSMGYRDGFGVTDKTFVTDAGGWVAVPYARKDNMSYFLQPMTYSLSGYTNKVIPQTGQKYSDLVYDSARTLGCFDGCANYQHANVANCVIWGNNKICAAFSDAYVRFKNCGTITTNTPVPSKTPTPMPTVVLSLTPTISVTLVPSATGSVSPTDSVSITPEVTEFPIESCPNKILGDANCDGGIDGVDYSYWVNSQCNPGEGQTCSSYDADFNSDGKVDDEDYKIWYDHRGTTEYTITPTISPVVEPTIIDITIEPTTEPIVEPTLEPEISKTPTPTVPTQTPTMTPTVTPANTVQVYVWGENTGASTFSVISGTTTLITCNFNNTNNSNYATAKLCGVVNKGTYNLAATTANCGSFTSPNSVINDTDLLQGDVAGDGRDTYSVTCAAN